MKSSTITYFIALFLNKHFSIFSNLQYSVQLEDVLHSYHADLASSVMDSLRKSVRGSSTDEARKHSPEPTRSHVEGEI